MTPLCDSGQNRKAGSNRSLLGEGVGRQQSRSLAPLDVLEHAVLSDGTELAHALCNLIEDVEGVMDGKEMLCSRLAIATLEVELLVAMKAHLAEELERVVRVVVDYALVVDGLGEQAALRGSDVGNDGLRHGFSSENMAGSS